MGLAVPRAGADELGVAVPRLACSGDLPGGDALRYDPLTTAISTVDPG
jgi:hypothetical protein